MADRDDAALRARFRTDKEGRFSFWSVVPSHYPIPDDGPVGEMLAATKRHPYRPAHVHFMIAKEGFEGLTTHIFRSEEHTSELQSLMRISYAVFCLKKKKTKITNTSTSYTYTNINDIKYQNRNQFN